MISWQTSATAGTTSFTLPCLTLAWQMRPCPVLTRLQWLWNLSVFVQQCWASSDVWTVTSVNTELLLSTFNIFLKQFQQVRPKAMKGRWLRFQNRVWHGFCIQVHHLGAVYKWLHSGLLQRPMYLRRRWNVHCFLHPQHMLVPFAFCMEFLLLPFVIRILKMWIMLSIPSICLFTPFLFQERLKVAYTNIAVGVISRGIHLTVTSLL